MKVQLPDEETVIEPSQKIFVKKSVENSPMRKMNKNVDQNRKNKSDLANISMDGQEEEFSDN